MFGDLRRVEQLLHSTLTRKKEFPFLGAFAKLRKATIVMSVCPSVRPSLRMKKLGSHWTEFHEILYLSIFRKTIEKIQV